MKCDKCGKPSGRSKYCKSCKDSFPSKGTKVHKCVNPDCKQEYCTNNIKPGYCPDCMNSVGVGRFVRKCVNCPFMTHTMNKDRPLCPDCLEKIPGEGGRVRNCINPDCGQEYRNSNRNNGYCPVCRNSVGVGNIVRKCIKCPVMTHTYSTKYPLCPRCLAELPGEGSKVLICDIHDLYKAESTHSCCPICFEEANGDGDKLYNCINPDCNKKYRSNSHNGASYCPDCRNNISGEGNNIVICNIHGPFKASGPNTFCPECVEKKEGVADAEKARFDLLPGEGDRETTCCIDGCEESFKTKARGSALKYQMCDKHKKEAEEAKRAEKKLESKENKKPTLLL